MASASIAQVHAAVLLDGREVVVKVVRPGIRKLIRRDIDLLMAIAQLAEKYWQTGSRVKPTEFVREFQTFIFDELDISALSLPLGVPQIALIDFSVGPVGAVFDVDNPVPGSTTPFALQGTNPIGFYLEYPSVPEPNGPIFTQQALNPGGLDLAAVYPIIGEPGAFGIGFVLPLDNESPPSLLPLAGYAVGPVSPVPIPGALGLWLLGLGGLAEMPTNGKRERSTINR